MLKAIIILVFLAAPRWPEQELLRFEFTRPVMGTQARIVLFAKEESVARRVADAAFLRLEVLNQILSDYLEESELTRLSRAAGGPAVPVSHELFTVLAHAQELAVRSDGAFDVTVGPLTQLWRRSRRQRQLPEPGTLAKAKALVGHRLMVLDREKQTVKLLRPGMRLDLGGIAKGYAVDEAMKVLKHAGVRHALVSLGGDIAVSEPPPGATGWVIQIAPLRPDKDGGMPALVLANQAVSTSGDAEQYVEIDGRRYAHIIDPSTGLGLRQRSSVTVVAPQGMAADALATAVSVLGPERGLALVDATPEAAAMIIRLEAAGEARSGTSRRWLEIPRRSN